MISFDSIRQVHKNSSLFWSLFNKRLWIYYIIFDKFMASRCIIWTITRGDISYTFDQNTFNCNLLFLLDTLSNWNTIYLYLRVEYIIHCNWYCEKKYSWITIILKRTMSAIHGRRENKDIVSLLIFLIEDISCLKISL